MTSQDTVGQLAPCPFCGSGGEEVALSGHLRASGHNDGWNVRCYVCHVETAYEDTKAEAIAAWNRRALPARQDTVGQLVERLRDALRQIVARTYSNDRGCELKADSVAEIHDIAAEALSTLPQGATFWVLEGPDGRRADDPIRYWRPRIEHVPSAYWTTDINEALHFARRRDAEAYHAEKTFSDRIKVVEHAWVTLPQGVLTPGAVDAATGSSVPGPHTRALIEGLSLHRATSALVNMFAAELAFKLAQAEQKYGYTDGWKEGGWEAECRRQLHHHAAKGDPLDVAAYAAFCWHHRWPTSLPAEALPQGEQEVMASVADIAAAGPSDCAAGETRRKSEGGVSRDISGETVCGFRVAAYRETHPEHGDKYGHRYSEHWSTPSQNPAVKVERLFTEDQLRAALLRGGR